MVVPHTSLLPVTVTPRVPARLVPSHIMYSGRHSSSSTKTWSTVLWTILYECSTGGVYFAGTAHLLTLWLHWGASVEYTCVPLKRTTLPRFRHMLGGRLMPASSMASRPLATIWGCRVIAACAATAGAARHWVRSWEQPAVLHKCTHQVTDMTAADTSKPNAGAATAVSCVRCPQSLRPYKEPQARLPLGVAALQCQSGLTCCITPQHPAVLHSAGAT